MSLLKSLILLNEGSNPRVRVQLCTEMGNGRATHLAIAFGHRVCIRLVDTNSLPRESVWDDGVGRRLSGVGDVGDEVR